MCLDDNEKVEREITKGIELLIEESIRTLGVKENYEYLWILETNTTEPVNILKIISAAEVSLLE